MGFGLEFGFGFGSGFEFGRIKLRDRNKPSVETK